MVAARLLWSVLRARRAQRIERVLEEVYEHLWDAWSSSALRIGQIHLLRDPNTITVYTRTFQEVSQVSINSLLEVLVYCT